jgi:transcriptional regulator with XRE-family HTH domain
MKEVTRLKRARIKSGLLAAEVCRRASISQSMYSRYENGWTNPSTDTAKRIADVLGVSPTELFDMDLAFPPGPRKGNSKTVGEASSTAAKASRDYLEIVLGKPEDAALAQQEGTHIRTIHVDKALEVLSVDRPGPGGICHQYEFYAAQEEGIGYAVGAVHFQEGKIKEAGVNGVRHEAVMSVIIDRLRALYVSGRIREKEEIALAHLLQARHALADDIPGEDE